jgi:hypothetical protein
MRQSFKLHGLQLELNRCLRQIQHEDTTQIDVKNQRKTQHSLANEQQLLKKAAQPTSNYTFTLR